MSRNTVGAPDQHWPNIIPRPPAMDQWKHYAFKKAFSKYRIEIKALVFGAVLTFERIIVSTCFQWNLLGLASYSRSYRICCLWRWFFRATPERGPRGRGESANARNPNKTKNKKKRGEVPNGWVRPGPMRLENGREVPFERGEHSQPLPRTLDWGSTSGTSTFRVCQSLKEFKNISDKPTVWV